MVGHHVPVEVELDSLDSPGLEGGGLLCGKPLNELCVFCTVETYLLQDGLVELLDALVRDGVGVHLVGDVVQKDVQQRPWFTSILLGHQVLNLFGLTSVELEVLLSHALSLLDIGHVDFLGGSTILEVVLLIHAA
jgi:hypothetical protein